MNGQWLYLSIYNVCIKNTQEDTLLSEEVFFNIELQRVQNSTSESDIDADGVSQEVTQMNHKVIFDRCVVVELKCSITFMKYLK